MPWTYCNLCPRQVVSSVRVINDCLPADTCFCKWKWDAVMSVHLGFLHGCFAQSIGVEYLWQAVSSTKPKISKTWPFTERILLTPGLEKYLCFNIFSSNPPRLRSYVSYFMDGKNLRPRVVRQFIQSSVTTKSSLSELGPRSLDSKGYVLWFHPSTKGFFHVCWQDVC